MARPHYLWCYGRVSSSKQITGDGRRRQEDRAWEEFATKYGFTVHSTFLFDEAVSAWDESNWGPKGQLGKFMAKAEAGREVRPGDCLGCECWDRLWKTGTRRVLQNLLRLQDCKIHIADVLQGKLFRYDSDDLMLYLDVLLTAKRGNEGSNTTSDRCLNKLEERARMAAAGELIHPNHLPSWIEVVTCDRDKPGARQIGSLKKDQYAILKLRDDAYTTLRLMLALARDGMGAERIVAELIRRDIPNWTGGPWSVNTVRKLLRDRRLLGDCRRRRLISSGANPNKRDAEVSWIAGVFPPVCAEGELLALNRHGSGTAGRRGRDAATFNPFRGLLYDPLLQSHWVLNYSLRHDGKYRPILVPSEARAGRAPQLSIDALLLRDGLCDELRDINPASVIGSAAECSDLQELNGKLNKAKAEYAAAKDDLDKKGWEESLADYLRRKGQEIEKLKAEYALALHRAEHPLLDSWTQQGELLRAIQSAPDEEAAWLALRARLEETCERIWLLVVPRGKHRLAAFQIDFKGCTQTGCRQGLILTRPRVHTPECDRPAAYESVSFRRLGLPDFPDLSVRTDALEWARVLAEVMPTPLPTPSA